MPAKGTQGRSDASAWSEASQGAEHRRMAKQIAVAHRLPPQYFGYLSPLPHILSLTHCRMTHFIWGFLGFRFFYTMWTVSLSPVQTMLFLQFFPLSHPTNILRERWGGRAACLTKIAPFTSSCISTICLRTTSKAHVTIVTLILRSKISWSNPTTKAASLQRHQLQSVL